MNTCLHTLMDAVDAAGLERRDFAEDAFALLATAISKLPPEERELVLGKIECGDLRQAVSQFDRPTYPKSGLQ
jgi:hypothetical protein